MNRILFTAFIWIILMAPPATAQVFPGDVNNDGIVNNVDLLFLGQVFFQTGPTRSPVDQGISFTEKVLVPWGSTFPNTTIDIGFADCDGSGFIDHTDLEAIEINYNLSHGTPTPTTVDPGQFGVDPLLYFDSTSLPGPIPEQLIALIPINLGTATLPVASYTGISFTINYDPNVFADVIISEIGAPWASVFGLFIADVDKSAGTIEVASSLGPQSPLIDNFGPMLGGLFIIEEDVVGIMGPDVPSNVYLSNILMMDGGLNPKSIVEDTVTIIITDYEITSTNDRVDSSLEVYPNPAEDIVFIKDLNRPILSWEIYDVAGHLLRQSAAINVNSCSIDTHDFSNGLYVLQVKTREGMVQKKIIIQH